MSSPTAPKTRKKITFIVNTTIGCVVVKLFHTIPQVTWAEQKHNTLDTPRLCQRASLKNPSAFTDPKWFLLSWELVTLRVNVSVSPLGLSAGNGRVESVFLCVGSGVRVEGFKKQKVVEFAQEIVHHVREGDSLRFCFICIHGGFIIHQKWEQVSLVIWTPAVFQISSWLFLRQTGVYICFSCTFVLLITGVMCCWLTQRVLHGAEM